MGTAAERHASKLRRSLELFGEVHSLVIDIFYQEWPRRAWTERTTTLLPGGGSVFMGQTGNKPGLFMPPPLLSQNVRFEPQFWREVSEPEAFERGWLSQKRWQRIERLVSAFRPDAVILSGVFFVSLARRFSSLGIPVALHDDGFLEGLKTLGPLTASPYMLRWFEILGTQVGAKLQAEHSYVDQFWGEELNEIWRRSPKVGNELFRPMSIVPSDNERLTAFAEDDGTFLVVPPPPFVASSRLRDLMAEECMSIRLQGDVVPPLRFLGDDVPWFDYGPKLAAAAAIYFSVGPMPGIPSLLDEAARSGVRVFVPRAILTDISSGCAKKVVPVNNIRGFLQHASELLTDANRADSRRPDQGGGWTESCAQLRAALGALVRREIQASEAEQTNTKPFCRPLRMSLHMEPPSLIYVQPSGMLLMQLTIRNSVTVTETRVHGSDGSYLFGNVHVSPPESWLARHLEAAQIVPEHFTASGFTVEILSNDVVIERIAFTPGEIKKVKAEIASLNLEGGTSLKGIVRLDDTSGEETLALQIENQAVLMDAGQPQRLGNTSSFIYSFESNLDQRPGPNAQITILNGRDLEPVSQRPLILGEGAVCSNPWQNHRVTSMRDSHRGRRAWFIGNGPSLQTEDLDRIPEDDLVFAFNRFYLAYDRTRLREDFIVSADMLMIHDFGQEMIDVAAGLPLFCFQDQRPFEELIGDYIWLQPSTASLPIFSMRADRAIAIGGSSVFVALQFAFHLGIRDFVMTGMDFSFSANPHRDPRYPFPVCYDDGNHFIPGYRSARPWCPPTWCDIITGFLNARTSIEQAGGRIVNATRGGRLEIFERVDIDRLLEPSTSPHRHQTL